MSDTDLARFWTDSEKLQKYQKVENIILKNNMEAGFRKSTPFVN